MAARTRSKSSRNFWTSAVRSDKPVVVVGSMRNPSTLAYEGAANLRVTEVLDACRIATRSRWSTTAPVCGAAPWKCSCKRGTAWAVGPRVGTALRDGCRQPQVPASAPARWSSRSRAERDPRVSERIAMRLTGHQTRALIRTVGLWILA